MPVCAWSTETVGSLNSFASAAPLRAASSLASRGDAHDGSRSDLFERPTRTTRFPSESLATMTKAASVAPTHCKGNRGHRGAAVVFSTGLAGSLSAVLLLCASKYATSVLEANPASMKVVRSSFSWALPFGAVRLALVPSWLTPTPLFAAFPLEMHPLLSMLRARAGEPAQP